MSALHNLWTVRLITPSQTGIFLLVISVTMFLFHVPTFIKLHQNTSGYNSAVTIETPGCFFCQNVYPFWLSGQRRIYLPLLKFQTYDDVTSMTSEIVYKQLVENKSSISAWWCYTVVFTVQLVSTAYSWWIKQILQVWSETVFLKEINWIWNPFLLEKSECGPLQPPATSNCVTQRKEQAEQLSASCLILLTRWNCVYFIIFCVSTMGE